MADARTIGEAIIEASDVSDETLSIDDKWLVLSAPEGAIHFDLRMLAATLSATPQPAPSGEAVTVTDAQIKAALDGYENSFFTNHQGKLIHALQAALSTLPAAPQGWRSMDEHLVRDSREILTRVEAYAPDIGVDEFLDAIDDARRLVARIDGAE